MLLSLSCLLVIFILKIISILRDDVHRNKILLYEVFTKRNKTSNPNFILINMLHFLFMLLTSDANDC